MAITVLNKKQKTESEKSDIKSEKIINEFIKKGGSTTKEQAELIEEDKLKGMNVKLYQSEIDQINEIRKRRPVRDKVSIHDFILEAIKEKVKREIQKEVK